MNDSIRSLRGLGFAFFMAAIILMLVGVVVIFIADNRIIGWIGIGLFLLSGFFYGIDNIRYKMYLSESKDE